MDDTTRLHRLVEAVDWGALRGATGSAHGFGRDLQAWLDGRGQPASVFNDDGGDAEALAGAVGLARIRRGDGAVAARLLEGSTPTC